MTTERLNELLRVTGNIIPEAMEEHISDLEAKDDELLPRECVVDLSSLRFMDSSGIAVIVRLSQRMKELGGRLWLEKPLGQPKRVIETAGIDRLAPVAITR